MKILSIDDMLGAASDSDMPGYDEALAALETAATQLAEQLAAHLGIAVHPADYERGYGGLCADFYPKTKDQPCPAVIEEGDPGGDWEYETNPTT